jgi:hypothetical protein
MVLRRRLIEISEEIMVTRHCLMDIGEEINGLQASSHGYK